MRYDKKTLAVQWHITDRCQKKCAHCYIGGRTCNEMTYLQVEKILFDLSNYAKKNGIHYEFYITGGDPLLHTQYCGILQLFHERGLSYSVMCNPESINVENLNKLSELGVRSIQFSVDGMKEKHDTIRGKKSFEKLVSAIEMTKNAKIPVAMMFTLYRFNSDDLFKVMKLADELQVERFSFDLGISIGSAEKNHLEMIPSLELIEVLKKYIALKKHIKEKGTKTFFEEKCNLINAIRISQGDFFCPDEEMPVIFDGCQIGVNDFVIDVDGDVLGCRRLGKSSVCGNLLKTSFEEIWCESPYLLEQRNKVLKKDKCKDCVSRSWCQGCEAYEQGFAQQSEQVAQVLCGQSLFIPNKSRFSEFKFQNKSEFEKIFILLDDGLKIVASEDFKKEYVCILFDEIRKREILNNYIMYSDKYAVSKEMARLLYYFYVIRLKM